MTLPHEVEKKILDMLGIPNLSAQTTGLYSKRLALLRKHLRGLSDNFARAQPYAACYADAHLAYNFPMNFMKTMIIARELERLYPEIIESKERISVLDVGCGEGAGMFGFYYGLRNTKSFVLHGIDASRHMLARAQALAEWLEKLDARVNVMVQKHHVSKSFFDKQSETCDIVILANSLAEMYQDTIPTGFIETIVKKITDRGLIIIIEPALKRLARRLMYLRSTTIRDNTGFVLLPCLHDHECPLQEIRKQREWCHQSLSWTPPEFMKIINRGLHREIDTLKFSYLVIAKKSSSIDKGFRVISPLLKEKGKVRCYLCTSSGRVEIVRLNKFATDQNREFGAIEKGDIIMLGNYIAVKPQYWEIRGTTSVQILYKR